MSFEEIRSKDRTYIAGTYNRFPVALCRGEGAVLYSEDGKKYVDFGSGIAVNTFGVNDEVWKKAVTDQLNKIQHASNLYYTRPQAHLAHLLVHGALHAQGWDHETDEEAELMEQKEREIMNELGFDDPYYDAARGH